MLIQTIFYIFVITLKTIVVKASPFEFMKRKHTESTKTQRYLNTAVCKHIC